MVTLVPLLDRTDASNLDALAIASSRLLDARDVTVSLMVDAVGVAVGRSSDLALRAHELQLALGEGPTLDGSRGAVRCPDLADDTRWPLAASRLRELGVVGVRSTPLRDGSECLGALTEYGTAAAPGRPTEPGALPSEDVASAVARTILRSGSILGPTGSNEPFTWLLTGEGRRSAVIHQASGMVAIQIGCDVNEALLRLRARAFADDLTPLEIARAVVERTVRFER